jgi:hypothetical protein
VGEVVVIVHVTAVLFSDTKQKAVHSQRRPRPYEARILQPFVNIDS